VAVVSFGAVAQAEEVSQLPLRHGIYVEANTVCSDASNATRVSFWGDQLNSAHVVGHIREVPEHDGSFVVTRDLEGDSGMGGNLRERVKDEITIDGPGEFSIENENGVWDYRWCAGSMDELAEMKRQREVEGTKAALPVLSLPNDAPPFMGHWGRDNGASAPCSADNLTTYSATDVGTTYSWATYDGDSYAEIELGHWRIKAEGVYEGQRFPLQYDLYLDGDRMHEIIETEDGRQQEANLVRCR